MPFTKALKGKKTNFTAPADVGTRPIRTTIVRRLCKDCKFYVPSREYCPIIGKVKNPDWSYCSFYKNNKEEK